MKRKLHTQLNRLIPSIANRVRDKQSQQKTAHDYHAKEREMVEGQAVYAKDFRHKKTWMSGTIVEKTGPVSTCVQLDNGTVIRRHQDHVRRRENEVVEEPVADDTPSVTPIALPEVHVTSPTPGVSHEPDVTKSSPATPATPTQTPVESSPPRTHPVQKRAKPGYLNDYLC